MKDKCYIDSHMMVDIIVARDVQVVINSSYWL